MSDREDTELDRAAAAERRTPIEPSRTCPNCGAVLDDRACKLICPTPGCGYYLSCSDYY